MLRRLRPPPPSSGRRDSTQTWSPTLSDVSDVSLPPSPRVKSSKARPPPSPVGETRKKGPKQNFLAPPSVARSTRSKTELSSAVSDDSRRPSAEKTLAKEAEEYHNLWFEERRRRVFLEECLNQSQLTVLELNRLNREKESQLDILRGMLSQLKADPESREQIITAAMNHENLANSILIALLDFIRQVCLARPHFRTQPATRLFRMKQRQAYQKLKQKAIESFQKKLRDNPGAEFTYEEPREEDLDWPPEPRTWYQPYYTFHEYCDAVCEAGRLQMKHHKLALDILDALRDVHPEVEAVRRKVYDHAVSEGSVPLTSAITHELTLEQTDDLTFVGVPGPSKIPPEDLAAAAREKWKIPLPPWQEPARLQRGVIHRFRPHEIPWGAGTDKLSTV